jgi:hypothetical protein
MPESLIERELSNGPKTDPRALSGLPCNGYKVAGCKRSRAFSVSISISAGSGKLSATTRHPLATSHSWVGSLGFCLWAYARKQKPEHERSFSEEAEGDIPRIQMLSQHR